MRPSHDPSPPPESPLGVPIRGAILVVASAFVAFVGLTAFDVYRTGGGQDRDVVREWVVARYVVAGRDPYSLAKDVLVAKYGVDIRGKAIWKIPSTVPESRRGDVIPEYGPPEATYPPGGIGFLAIGLGAVEDAAVVQWIWFVANSLSILALAILLARLWQTPPYPMGRLGNAGSVLVLLLLFVPVYTTLDRAQFSLAVLALVLLMDDPRVAWPIRGVALALALLKPSVALPLMLLPLVRREWRVLATAALVQAASTAYVMAKIGREPLSLHRDWLAASRYFLGSGIYTFQEWVPTLSARLPWVVPFLPLIFLAVCGATLFVNRDAPRARLFSLAAATAFYWIHHGPYEGVLLLPMLMRRIGWSEGPPPRRWSPVGVALFVVFSMAFSEFVIRAESPAWRAFRWFFRASLIAALVLEYVELFRDGRRGVFRSAGARPSLVPSPEPQPA